jgi:TATA-box binding protein (TBP) (component of TFIID and TFIIIB)
MDNFSISTQTLIVSMNINIDCQNFYNFIQCYPNPNVSYGKSKTKIDSPQDINEGSILFARYKHEYKGTPLKKIKEKYFLNSVTLIMKIDTKFINIKVSNKGKLQITGCSQNVYAVKILKYIWGLIQSQSCRIWNWNTDQHIFEAKIIPVMCNINFSIGFQINRETLNQIINTQTKHISILETSDGYVGVNIKISANEEPIEEICIDQYTFENEKWISKGTKLIDYIHTLSPKEQKKKIAKCYVNTFLIFYSGKVIMSGGTSYINRKRAYEEFMSIIQKYKTNIISE